MAEQGVIERVARGTVAGLMGAMALQVLHTMSQRWLPQTMPPYRQDPGDFMVEQVEAVLPRAMRQRVPPIVETGAARLLAVGYGLTAGALYALFRPRGGQVVSDGILFGLLVWAVGYLGWIPALGLLPPIPEQDRAAVIAPPIRHTVFGIVTVAAYRWLSDRAGRRVSGL